MQQYASFTGLMRTLLILLLIYYGVKILMRIFAPQIFNFLTKKAEKRFNRQFGGFQQPQQPKQKEGEITIDKMPNTKTSNNDVGEYVDYEEID